MKLTIFGATGGIGSALLEQAVAAGHEVTVLVRTPSKLKAKVHHVITGDARDEVAVANAITPDTDVVLSALGPRNMNERLVAHAAKSTVRAMEANGVRRFIGISASGIHVDEHDLFILKFAKTAILDRVLATHYADLRAMESEIVASPLQWTLVCPPYLTDKPVSGKYRMAIGHNVDFGFSMRRADVAKCMLDVISQPQTVGQRVFPAN
jgi:putative NADH-flavin reductase